MFCAGMEEDLQRFKSLLERMLQRGIYGDLEDVARKVTKKKADRILFVEWFSFLLRIRSKQLEPIRNLGHLDMLYALDEVYGGIALNFGFIKRGPFDPATSIPTYRGYELVSSSKLEKLRKENRFEKMDPAEVFALFNMTDDPRAVTQWNGEAKALEEMVDAKMEWFGAKPGFFIGDLLPQEAKTVGKKFIQHIRSETKRMALMPEVSHRVNTRVIASMSEAEQLELWRKSRETWMAHFGYGGIDDLYLERRLNLELPDYEFCPRTQLGGKWKGELSGDFGQELAALHAEVRFHRPTKRPVLAAKWPIAFADTRFSRWVIKHLPQEDAALENENA